MTRATLDPLLFGGAIVVIGLGIGLLTGILPDRAITARRRRLVGGQSILTGVLLLWIAGWNRSALPLGAIVSFFAVFFAAQVTLSIALLREVFSGRS